MGKFLPSPPLNWDGDATCSTFRAAGAKLELIESALMLRGEGRQ